MTPTQRRRHIDPPPRREDRLAVPVVFGVILAGCIVSGLTCEARAAASMPTVADAYCYTRLTDGAARVTDDDLPWMLVECRAVLDACDRVGLPWHVGLALAYHESRMSPEAVSRTRARGTLQVTTIGCQEWIRLGQPGGASYGRTRWVQWQGERRACDPLAAGAWQMRVRLDRQGDVRTAACRYTAGAHCEVGGRGWAWAGRVAWLAERWAAGVEWRETTRGKHGAEVAQGGE